MKKSMYRRALAVAASSLAFGGGVAVAQDSADSVGTVIVTAQKRAQDIQDV